MHPAGLAQVEAAKADGRWERTYPSASTIAVHPMLQAALDRSPTAQAAFDGLSSANRDSVLYDVFDTANDTTRARRVAKAIEMLEAGKTQDPSRAKEKQKTASKARTVSRGRRSTSSR
ncbi:MAG: YdeI/OmpD-associated family protein [Myxococcota bacterium]